MTPADPEHTGGEPGRVVDARPGATGPARPAPGSGSPAADPAPQAPVPEESAVEEPVPEEPVPEGSATGVVADPAPPPADPDESAEAAWVAEEEAAAEVVEGDLAGLAAERDQYLDQLRRLQADFENYRKRVQKQQEELAERATEGLVAELLPVLDAGDAAVAHGDESVAPVVKALTDALGKAGLERVSPEGEPFDPTRHEAVTHEPGDGEQVVTEVLRSGYVWKGRVLRPAMVRVRG